MGRIVKQTAKQKDAKAVGVSLKDVQRDADGNYYTRHAKTGKKQVISDPAQVAVIEGTANRDAYQAKQVGTTHDARGQEQALHTQQIIKGSKRGVNKKRTYRLETDPGWDNYAKTVKEMRHRVQYGVRNRRNLEMRGRAGKFGPGQMQRLAAAGRAGQARAGTLITSMFDE